jgi:hypothetical protein
MAKTIKYTGTQDPWPELAITGNQAVWHLGQQESREDQEANALLKTGLFSVVSTAARIDSNQNSVLGADSVFTLQVANPRGRMVVLGDSLGWGGSPGRRIGFFDGIPTYNSTVIAKTNLGNSTWIVDGYVDGRASTAGGAAAGTIDHDGNGSVRWKYQSDSYGPYVNVSQGGWFQLQSGTAINSGIVISVRGATAPPAAGTGAVTTSGLVTISTYNLLGYAPWMAGAFPETFSDIQVWAISGCTSADALKYAPQALAAPVEAVTILIGVNDNPGTAAAAATVVANVKALIDLAASKANRVYVQEIFPNTSTTATVQGFNALVSSQVKQYCRSKKNCRFVSAYSLMVDPNASAVTRRTGVFHTDNLHLMPYGGYRAALPLVAAIRNDYPPEPVRYAINDTWDATLGVGAWNLNPALRGTAGTVTGGGGVTGTCPDSWTLARTGSAQTCTTSFDAAPDGGADFFSMSVAAAASGDRHDLSRSVNVPVGINVGDYFHLEVEFCVYSCTGTGLIYLQAHANSNGNIQADYVFQIGRNVATFGTENPILNLTSEPQQLLAGVTSFTMNIRIGADVGGTGKVGFRKFRLKKATSPSLV